VPERVTTCLRVISAEIPSGIAPETSSNASFGNLPAMNVVVISRPTTGGVSFLLPETDNGTCVKFL